MSPILLTILQAFYLASPLIFASAVFGVVLRFDLLPVLKRPLDGGATLRGRRLFGDNKTWRGLLVAVAASVVGVWIQRDVVGARVGAVAVVDYAAANPVALGAALGLGAMLGELPNSFVKRQLDVAPGTTARGPRAALFYLWDQVDMLMLTWPLLLPWVTPRPALVGTTFALAVTVHPLVSFIGYLVGARKSAR